MGHYQRGEIVVNLRIIAHCRISDSIFEAWDGLGKGTIGGDTAIQIFSQTGLPSTDLEKIWSEVAIRISNFRTLADPGNKGKLDRDEFAVAFHLVYSPRV